MAAGSTVQASGPMSVKEISAKAEEFEFDTSIALKYWLRTADTLLREARIYEHEDNDQQAFLLLMRYATLVAYKLPSHPGREPEDRVKLRAAAKTLPKVLDRLDSLKPQIDARHNAWQKALAQSGRESMGVRNKGERPGSQAQFDLAALDPAVAGKSVTLGAAENSDLAVKLAHKEIKRRETKRRAIRESDVSKEERQRQVEGLWDDWEFTLSRKNQTRNDDQMRQNMEDAKRSIDGTYGIVADGAKKTVSQAPSHPTWPPPQNRNNEYQYPPIRKPQALRHNEAAELLSRMDSPAVYLPPLPPKEQVEVAVQKRPPTPPGKAVVERPDSSQSLSPPSTYTFRPSAYLENGKPLRTVFLPQTLRQKFLEVAEPNTRRNLETCGMLCGTLISNALFISKVVIPEQESTSDTCDTINESAFFDYCASEDLMVLGWIHTHPTQTCFMSSRDLHTHCGYQIMMPESIAIVCAPSKTPSWGVFRLTDPPGMQSVLNCHQTGLFHPHSEPNVYTDALRPGHVFEADGMEFELVDLRPK